MSYPHRLDLSPEERAELTTLRDTAPLPYLRERAAALLKVADGERAAQVARTGLLRPRQPDTVYAWLHRYRAEGIAGLSIRPGRGRKPAFSPSPAQRGGGPRHVGASAAPRSAHLRGEPQSLAAG
jgi:Winged helix-turn helix